MMPTSVVSRNVSVRTPTNAGMMLTRTKGNSGTRRRASRYDQALRRMFSASFLACGPKRSREEPPKTVRAKRNTSVAPVVAPTTVSTVPAIGPNRNPPVRVRRNAPGSEKATTAM